MGREGGIMAQSSIALLQERFRQLERAKELREERELLSKVLFLSEPNNLNLSSINHNKITSFQYEAEAEADRLSFHPDRHHMFFRPPLSLSLWPPDLSYNTQRNQKEYGETAPLFVSLWAREKPGVSSSLALLKRLDEDLHDADEVDTSLHL